jgi:excisionase family DNA binding protein
MLHQERGEQASTDYPDLERILTPEQVAEILQISKSSLCRLTKRGQIPHRRIGDRIVRYNRNEIEAWMKARIS